MESEGGREGWMDAERHRGDIERDDESKAKWTIRLK